MENNKGKLIIFAIILFILFATLFKNSYPIFLLIIVFIAVYLFKYLREKKIINNVFKQNDKDEKENKSKIYNINSFINKFMLKIKKTVLSIVLLVIVLILLFSSIIVVEAGMTGVYSLFGKIADKELGSGIHLINPLGKVTKMSIRTEEYTMSIAPKEGRRIGDDSIVALTKEGLSVILDITALYRLEESKASDVYRTLGLNYEEKLVRPEIRSTIREVIATYEAKDIYSEKREEASQKIFVKLESALKPRGIITEKVLLRNIQLPDNLGRSIQEKLQAEQEAQKYDFILAREKKEKERKIIEAEGQRDAQKIINESLTTNYLYYLYIKELKDRQGTIYVPTNPSTGMPLFKDLGQ